MRCTICISLPLLNALLRLLSAFPIVANCFFPCQLFFLERSRIFKVPGIVVAKLSLVLSMRDVSYDLVGRSWNKRDEKTSYKRIVFTSDHANASGGGFPYSWLLFPYISVSLRCRAPLKRESAIYISLSLLGLYSMYIIYAQWLISRDIFATAIIIGLVSRMLLVEERVWRTRVIQ